MTLPTNGICMGCAKAVPENTYPAQAVLLLPHAPGVPMWPPTRGALAFRAEQVSRFCTVRCLRDWCERILSERYA